MTDAEVKLLMLRNLRNDLLRDSDWVAAKAFESGTTVSSAWKTYRQELRDITKTFKSIGDTNFKFPDKPEEQGMPYIGRSEQFGVRSRFQYQATGCQTSFSGSDANSLSLSYSDSLYIF